jgi:oligoendopeptidase F
LFDVSIPLVEHHARYSYDDVVPWIIDSVAGLGAEYQQHVRDAFNGRWIDVFENTGKRSGAYSAPVYGTHPYMLLNFNETLDAVFTLAHEMGHSMHTLLAHRAQPFVYAGYTIFVAEVPSTLNEALFLDFMLERAGTDSQRAVLLQHAIDSITSTFYTQVMFADYELQAHRLVEQDQPVTADVLNTIYASLLDAYYGDVIDREEISKVTWARIPHFFSTPYYVYQYATCFASTARLMQGIRSSNPGEREDAVNRYLNLLQAGGSDYPMNLLARAGVDLSQPDTVRAVATELDMLVARLEQELGAGVAGTAPRSH